MISGQQQIIETTPILDATQKQLNLNDPDVIPTFGGTATITEKSGQHQIDINVESRQQ